MKSLVPKAYRSVTPNDVTAGWSAAAAVTGIAVTDDKEENDEEEDCVGEDHSKTTSDEEYIPDDIDNNSDKSNDDEEEYSWREVEKDQEKEEGKQEDDNADEDGLHFSDTNVYLGHPGQRYPGSQDYRNTVKRLAKSCSMYWNEVF
jgi:hypothetical protein